MVIETDKIFPIIKDNSDFIKSHPDLHPHSSAYEKYWGTELERLLIGYWGKEVDEYRYIPPQLYYFINYHTMIVKKQNSKQRVKSRPFLLDINFTILNCWFICRGFSGFEGDSEYTCNWAVKEKEKQFKDSTHHIPKVLLETITDSCYKEDGTLKKFIDPLEYLNSTHKEPLGLPLYDNFALNFFMFGSRGGGKATPLSTNVLGEKGWVKMGDLKVGDKVYDRSGKLTNVIALHPQGKLEVYKVKLHDGREVECCGDHLWVVKQSGGKEKVMSTLDMYNVGIKYSTVSKGNAYKFKIPNCSPIEYPEVDLPLDPYILGALLGDGTMTTHTPKIASSDPFIIDEFQRILGSDFEIRRDFSTTNNHTIVDRLKCEVECVSRKGNAYVSNKGNRLTQAILNLGLTKSCSEKFIPSIYKTASIEQRFDLLRGLMDTDGSVNKDGSTEFTNTNLNLIRDVADLCRSLGIRCQIGEDKREGQAHEIKGHKCVRSKYYRLYINTTKEIFRLPRKLELLKNKKYQLAHDYISIVDIEKTNTFEEQQCITVDNLDHTYLTTDYVVTHNSFIASSIMEHEFFTDGCKSVDEFLKRNNKVEIFCGAPLAGKSSDLLDKFKQSLDNLPGEYKSGNSYSPAPFSKQCSGTLKVANSKNPYRFIYEKKIGNATKLAGTGTLLKHETFKDNKQAAVGGRYSVLVIEEVGLEDSLLTIHGANRSTQDLGDGKFGSSLYIGTSGDVDKVVETEIIFRDPEAYDFLAFPDIYESRNKIGFFLPAPYTNIAYKDEMGNTKIDEAMEYEYYIRDVAKQAGNTAAYDELIMSRPIKPSEMFMSRTGNKFPIAMLREQQATNDRYNFKKNLRTVGSLVEDKDYIHGVKFKPDFDLRPIDRFPHDSKSDIRGAWEFYEHPPAGVVQPGLYKIVYDPIRDEGGGTSLAAIYVYKSNNTLDLNGNELVAWWVGRLDLPDDIHFQCVLASKYFNAQVMFENNILDFKNYCMRTGNYQILAPTPKTVIEKAVKDPNLKYDVGVPITTPLKQYAIRLIQQWLLEEKSKQVEELIDGTTREVIIRNLHTIKDDLLLEELIQYNDKGNFDRVSALILLVLWLEQDKEVVIKKDEEVAKTTTKDFYKDLRMNELKSKTLITY